MTIKEIRERTGLSQSQFAKKYGISVRTLQGWESGKRPPECVPFLLDRCVSEDFEKVVDNGD